MSDKESVIEESTFSIYGRATSSFPLPFYKYLNIPANDTPVEPNPMFAGESCAGKIITGAAMGTKINC